MRARLEAFALWLHPGKTRLIESAATRRSDAKGAPAGILDFTMICGKSQKRKFLVWRKSWRDRLQAKLTAVTEEPL
jgi:RNA-directed DNA polymerase